MGPRARPTPFLSAPDQACAHRVQLDIPHCRHQVPFVHNIGSKSPLPQVACPPLTLVERRSVALVRPGKHSPQAIRSFRRNNEVDVIRHEAVGPNLSLRLSRRLRDQSQIPAVLPIIEEDALAPIAPLGHMMRRSGDHEPCEPCHDADIASLEQRGNQEDGDSHASRDSHRHYRSTSPNTMSRLPRMALTSASMWPRFIQSMAARWGKPGARILQR
jgi:hypothetical protein